MYVIKVCLSTPYFMNNFLTNLVLDLAKERIAFPKFLEMFFVSFLLE